MEGIVLPYVEPVCGDNFVQVNHLPERGIKPCEEHAGHSGTTSCLFAPPYFFEIIGF
jgi:hypothetical protein